MGVGTIRSTLVHIHTMLELLGLEKGVTGSAPRTFVALLAVPLDGQQIPIIFGFGILGLGGLGLSIVPSRITIRA